MFTPNLKEAITELSYACFKSRLKVQIHWYEIDFFILMQLKLTFTRKVSYFYGSLVLKATVWELGIAYWYSLTEFSFHFFTSSDFIDKFALKGIHIRIKLTRKPSI